MKRILSAFLLLCFSGAGLMAQLIIPDDLAGQLRGKTKYDDIEREVRIYYRNKIQQASADNTVVRGLSRQMKYWNRYLWFAERHLNTNGEMENVTKKYAEVIATGAVDNNSSPNSFFGDWQPYGPDFVDDGCGRVDRIAFDPVNANILYAGSPAGGLLRSINNGASWQALSQYGPSLGVSGIVVDYANPNRLFILSGDGDSYISGGFVNDFGYIRYSTGIYRSDDAGSTWYKTATLPGLSDDFVNTTVNYVGFSLKQHPSNPNTLYAATSAGLYRTDNGGASWQKANIFNGSVDISNTRVWDVEFKPGSPDIIFLALNAANSFAISLDGGARFDIVTNGLTALTNFTRVELAVTPSLPNNVYLLAGGPEPANPFRGFYLSTTGGTSFSLRTMSPNIFGTQYGTGGPNRSQANYDIALAINPINTNQLLMGGISIWRSNDGGVNWTEVIDWTFDYLSSNYGDANYVHADIHNLSVNPLNNRIYVACDGGMAWTDDVGSNWTQIHSLPITQFYKIEGVNERGHVWGGAQDNGIIEFNDDENDNAYAYKTFRGGDGYDVLTDVENQNDSYWTINGSIYADGVLDINITIPNDTNNFFHLLAMHPSDEDIIYSGSGSGLWRSFDRGSNWGFINGNSCRGAIAVCADNVNRIYAANTVLIRTDNILVPTPTVSVITPPQLSGSTFPVSAWARITGIAVNPFNSSDVWISVAGYGYGIKVFRSTDAGANWQNLSGSLPNLPVNCIKMDQSGNVYIGTDIGVYVRNSSLSDWTPFYNGLPRVPVTDIEFRSNPTFGSPEVLVSTFGRGIWRTTPFQSCVPDLFLSGNIGGQQFFQAGNNIWTQQIIISNLGTNVQYRSGNKINLTNGFKAPVGSTVVLKIAGCNGGIPSNAGTRMAGSSGKQ